MQFPHLEPWQWVVAIGSPSFWLAAYVLAIRKGIRDRVSPFPAVAVCANVAVELLAVASPGTDLFFRGVNLAWLIPDLFLLWLVFKFGAGDWNSTLVRKWWPASLLVVIAGCAVLEFAFIRTYNDPFIKTLGCWTDLLISGLLVGLVLRRQHSRGLSPAIALCILAGNILGFWLCQLPGNPAPFAIAASTFGCIIPLNVLLLILVFRYRS
jgi:hypothetical protein